MIQVVSDIDFTICTPQKTQEPFYAKCLMDDATMCPIVQLTGSFPRRYGRCETQSEAEFHASMACPYRDAFSEEFYTWLASLDFEGDEPIRNTVSFLKKQPIQPILLTNRDEQCRDKTIQFMAKHGIPFSALLMRPKGDFRPLWEFKIEMIQQLATQHSQILWLDDQEPPIKPANVEWRHPDLILSI